MAGVAGASIGLASGAQVAIGMGQASLDGTESGRGCTTNFIGFGKGQVNTVQNLTGSVVAKDYNATDDTVTECNTLANEFAPTYTGNVLSWVDTTPPP